MKKECIFKKPLFQKDKIQIFKFQKDKNIMILIYNGNN